MSYRILLLFFHVSYTLITLTKTTHSSTRKPSASQALENRTPISQGIASQNCHPWRSIPSDESIASYPKSWFIVWFPFRPAEKHQHWLMWPPLWKRIPNEEINLQPYCPFKHKTKQGIPFCVRFSLKKSSVWSSGSAKKQQAPRGKLYYPILQRRLGKCFPLFFRSMFHSAGTYASKQYDYGSNNGLLTAERDSIVWERKGGEHWTYRYGWYWFVGSSTKPMLAVEYIVE